MQKLSSYKLQEPRAQPWRGVAGMAVRGPGWPQGRAACTTGLFSVEAHQDTLVPAGPAWSEPVHMPMEKLLNISVKPYTWNIWIYTKTRFYPQASSQSWVLFVSNWKVIFNRAISKLSSRSGFLCTERAQFDSSAPQPLLFTACWAFCCSVEFFLDYWKIQVCHADLPHWSDSTNCSVKLKGAL